MRIVDLEAFEVALPFQAPVLSAFGVSYPARVRTFVRLHTDEGFTGIGETGASATHPYRLGSMRERFTTSVRDAVLGEDPCDHQWIARKLFFSSDAAAVELACWDILGKKLGQPLYRLWGGRGVRDEVPIAGYAFFRLPNQAGEGGVDLASMPEHCRALREEHGFGVVKIKLGAHPPEEELPVVATARELLGPDVGLRIDPNGSWSVPTAVRSLRKVEGLDLEYVEEPIRAMGTGDSTVNTTGLRRLRAAAAVPIAADHCYRLDLLAQIIRDDAADIVLADLFGCGGISQTLRFVRTAASFGYGVAMHSGTELGVGQIAKVHLQAALDEEILHAGDAMYLEYVDDVLEGGKLPVRGGCMSVPTAPGLGVELSEERLARWELTPARKRDLDAYWRDLKASIGVDYPAADHLMRHY